MKCSSSAHPLWCKGSPFLSLLLHSLMSVTLSLYCRFSLVSSTTQLFHLLLVLLLPYLYFAHSLKHVSLLTCPNYCYLPAITLHFYICIYIRNYVCKDDDVCYDVMLCNYVLLRIMYYTIFLFFSAICWVKLIIFTNYDMDIIIFLDSFNLFLSIIITKIVSIHSVIFINKYFYPNFLLIILVLMDHFSFVMSTPEITTS